MVSWWTESGEEFIVSTVAEQRRPYGDSNWINHRDLRVWHEAMDMVQAVYVISAGYPKSETYGLTDQTRRAAVSVAANIAEGAGRPTTPDLLRILGIARASLQELDTLIEIAKRLEYSSDFSAVTTKMESTGKMLTRLIQSIREKNQQKE